MSSEERKPILQDSGIYIKPGVSGVQETHQQSGQHLIIQPIEFDTKHKNLYGYLALAASVLILINYLMINERSCQFSLVNGYQNYDLIQSFHIMALIVAILVFVLSYFNFAQVIYEFKLLFYTTAALIFICAGILVYNVVAITTAPCVPLETTFVGLITALDNSGIQGQNNVFTAQDGIANMSTNIPQAADRIRDEPESVWVEFIQLALDHKPLNLGQGFPDFAAPQYLIDSLHNATNNRDQKQVLNNQYTRSFGHPALVKALAKYYREFRSFERLQDANDQILITVGAYEALFASIMAFVNPGDEVLIVDPAFDAYAPIVEMAQGKTVFIPLRLSQNNSKNNNTTNQVVATSSAAYALDMKEFESKITNRTKLLILNTPNNPLGKMYSQLELEQIAKLCIEHNILVVADEVYEQMYYLPEAHLSIASLPNMWERTITVGSAGKTFSVTGWKIGWAFGPKHLIKYVQLVHQTAIYTVATPLQEALARALEHEMDMIKSKQSNYWDELRSDLVRKRDRMASILERAQMRPVVPQGGYFMLADFSTLAAHFVQYKQEGQMAGKPNTNDYKFARWLSRSKKLQGIPASAFYSDQNKPLAENLVRFCFSKQDATLDKLEALISNLTVAVESLSPTNQQQQPVAGQRSKL